MACRRTSASEAQLGVLESALGACHQSTWNIFANELTNRLTSLVQFCSHEVETHFIAKCAQVSYYSVIGSVRDEQIVRDEGTLLSTNSSL